MSDIENLLRQSFRSHHDTVTVDNDLFDRAITRGARRARRRQLAFGGAAATVVVALVASLAFIVSMRGPAESDLPVSDASAAWWSAVDIADPSIFSGDGDTFISQITAWQDQLVVLGVMQPSSGSTSAYAWTTDDGVKWERRQQDLPAGCLSNGVVALEDRLAVTCTIPDTSPDGSGARIGVATTSDLVSWTLTPISENGQWFGSLIGEGPDGAVVVQALAADDPNTTRGSTMRIWSSSDLAMWTPIVGEASTTLVDGSAASIRTVDGHLVVTGVFNDWADQSGPDQSVRMVPAIWVSTDGASFVRTLLGSSDGSTGPSAAVMDVASNGSGYVAVGTAGDPPDGLAWSSPDLVEWSTVIVAGESKLGSEVDDLTSRSVWDVVALPDGTLLAAGDGHPGGGSIAEGWLSDDGGASWRTVGVSPDLLAVWNGRAVGMTSAFGSQPTFWSWAGGIPARSSDSEMVDLGSADDLEVGEVRWYAEHRLYLVRTDSAVLALAQKSPQQGCRLALATDVDLGALPDGAVFTDPCHGASFALDGTHLGGPSPRDMDHYRVEVRSGRITVDTTRLLPATTER